MQDGLHASAIASICAIDRVPPSKNEDAYELVEGNEIVVYCYRLNATPLDGNQLLASDESDSTDVPVLSVHELPSVAFQTVWNSLYFEDGLRTCLLRQAIRMIDLFSDEKLDTLLHNWNRVILL